MSLVLDTEHGRVRGAAVGGTTVFRGIPYARPPFGANRFAPPQPPASWDGVRDALVAGPGCPQPVLDPGTPADRFYNPPAHGEDCLTLDVWTPDTGGAALPVMVWIHGGGFMAGAGSVPAHDGPTWTRDGVVYVSINYRLHADGFLYFDGGPANLGLQDQVAALRWVQANIGAFGGDPGNVSIFGQSAGAVSVMHLLTMPSARGLFRRAIAQSGSSAGAETRDGALEITHRFAARLGIEPTADAFAALPIERLLAETANLAIEYLSPALWGHRSFMISPFRPVIDGDVVPDAVVPAAAGGASAEVDLLAGTTRDEMTFAMHPLGLLETVVEPWAATALDAFGLERDDLDAYRKVSRPDADLPELLQAAWTDWAFRVPTIRLLEAHAPQAGGTFAYEFCWPSPSIPAVGASHALDHPFVFDRLDFTVGALAGPDNQLGEVPPQGLADTMHRAWVDFATHGDPGWPAYDTERRTTMRFDETSAPVDDPPGAERELWTGRR